MLKTEIVRGLRCLQTPATFGCISGGNRGEIVLKTIRNWTQLRKCDYENALVFYG